MSQTALVEDIAADQPGFYLLQAMQAKTADLRLAIRHVGLETLHYNNDYIISATLNGYPALQAGLRRGDKLVAVDGAAFHPLYSFNTYPIGSVQPLPRTAHVVSVERDGNIISVELSAVEENLFDSRRSATAASLQEFSAGNKTIAYLHLWTLSRGLNDLLSFVQIMNDLSLSDGLVLDLRESNGYLSIQHLHAFLSPGFALFTLAGPGNEHTRIDTREVPLRDRPYGKPIAILLNNATSGGAELLAYQLAKLDRVTTIGEPSAGALGEFELLERNGATAFLYRPPLATTLDSYPLIEFRVEPKLPLPYPLTLPTRSDPQFEAAFNVLMGRI